MPLFLDLLDSIGKKKTDDSGVNDARVLGVSDTGLALRLPDNSASAKLNASVFRNLGIDVGADVTTNPTILNLDGMIENLGGGNLAIDFTSLGGERFQGTQQELGNLQGEQLLKLIGNAATQNSAGGTLNNRGVGQNSLLGGQSVTTQIAQPDLRTQNVNSDVANVNSLIKSLESENISQGLFDKLSVLDDSETDEFLNLFAKSTGN